MRAKRPHPESVAGTASRRDHDRCSAGQPEFAEWARLLSNDGAAIPCWGYLPRVCDGAVFRPTSWGVQPEELWSVACADCSRSPDADSAVKAAVERFEGIDRARQQRRQLLRGLLRGTHARADRAPVRGKRHRPDERHARRPAGHAPATLRARRVDLVAGRPRRRRVHQRLRRVEVRHGRLDGVAGRCDRAVRPPRNGRQPRVLPHRAAHQGVDESTPSRRSRTTPSAAPPCASSSKA
jgi:hypothetical protein